MLSGDCRILLGRSPRKPKNSYACAGVVFSKITGAILILFLSLSPLSLLFIHYLGIQEGLCQVVHGSLPRPGLWGGLNLNFMNRQELVHEKPAGMSARSASGHRNSRLGMHAGRDNEEQRSSLFSLVPYTWSHYGEERSVIRRGQLL